MSTLNVTNISDGTNSTSTTNVVKGSAKAWVNFNGTGTVAIRNAHNVTSITDINTGEYDINFTSNIGYDDYCALGTCRHVDGFSADGNVSFGGNLSGSSFRIFVTYGNVSYVDVSTVCLAVHA